MAATAQLKSAHDDAMPGSDRVAAILLTMGNPLASNLMKYFEPDEIRRVTRSAADLKPVSSARLRGLIEDFATEFALGANLVGNEGEVAKLLAGAMSEEQVDEIMGSLHTKPEIPVWERISEVNESELAAYVAGEHPQTAALILSKVKSSCAARVITRLPPDRRDGIFRRMIAVKPIVDETLAMLERILRDEFSAETSSKADADSQARIAEIINKLDREDMDSVMQGLEATSPKTAESLKSLMFSFEDVTKLTPSARASVFDKVAADKLVLSLKGTEADFRDMVLSSLSGRVRKMIEQELESGQPVPQRDVNDARRVVTDLVLEMSASGAITIGGEEEAEEEYVS